MKDNRDHKSVVEIITKIEETFDVNSLIYNDLQVWPWIRLSIWTQLNNPHINYSSEKSTVSKYFLNDQAIHQINDLKKHENIDFTFFSRPEDYTDKSNGKFYNRHLDPIIDQVKKKFRFIKIELLNSESEKTTPRFEKTIFLQKPIKNQLYESNKRFCISNFQSFEHHVNIKKNRIKRICNNGTSQSVELLQSIF